MNLLKHTSEKVDDYYKRLLANGYIPSATLQGISRMDLERLLNKIGKFTPDIMDTIWCLLDNTFPNLYPSANGHSISDGASVAHIGGYVGILLRSGNRLDREGRDYWIKPLKEVGIIEDITLRNNIFCPGHFPAKSPNCCYRLNSSFISLLRDISLPNFDSLLSDWISSHSINKRQNIFASLKNNYIQSVECSSHKKLIYDSIEIYSKSFLPGYIPIFIDSEDGNRITDEEKNLLKKHQIIFGLIDDVWPDVILINPTTDSLWFIEAVTSDGEADYPKTRGLEIICHNSNKCFAGVTTTYESWKVCASRQARFNNLAHNSHFWIRETPNKHFVVK